MTSEVLVMNSMAVVLAADSALTRSSSNSDKQYYSNGGNKIFSLSTAKRANIGIMIYNQTSICGAPWELLIKSFRHENVGKTFNTVKECSEKFFKFIEENKTLIKNEVKEENSFQEIINLLGKYSNESKGEIENTFQNYKKEFSVLPSLDDNQNTFLKEIISKYTQDVKPYKEKKLQEGKGEEEKIQILDKEFCTLIFKRYLFDKKYYYPMNYTGIVISGFGETEEYPSYIQNECYGFSLYNLYKVELTKHSITGITVHGFAQSQMLELLLNRVNNKFYHFMLKTFIKEVHATIGQLLGDTDAQDKLNTDILEASIQKSMDKFQAEKREKFLDPLLQSVSAMSILELSTLAKTIVELEALNERLSEPSQSVGGPTDIISITKNEGLIWIKRKHYFEKDLNPSYFENLNLN